MLPIIEKPVFFIGVPRSGTTVLFEAFARHEAVAWPSVYSRMYPSFPAMNFIRQVLDNRFIQVVGKKKQHAVVLPGNRYLPTPDEAYEFWDKAAEHNFSRSYLFGMEADDEVKQRVKIEVSKIMKWQGKQRFVAKLTGPARIEFIRSIFPDAIFIHAVRDGASVVRSLLQVEFWRQGGGYTQPWWPDGFPDNLVAYWKENDQLPSVLAALQWRHIIETAREEAKALQLEQYLEVNYQKFVDDPKETVNRILKFSGLESSKRTDAYIDVLPQRKSAINQRQKAIGSLQEELLHDIYNSVTL